MSTTHTMTIIECQCRTCATNAAKLGRILPLRAEITESLAALLTTRKEIHNVVETAHHPGLAGGNPLVTAVLS